MPGALNGSFVTVSNLLSNQTYTVSGKDINGCIGTATTVVVVSKCLGIDSAMEGQFQISPNPFSTELTITSNRPTKLKMYDMLGNEVINTFLTVGSNTVATEHLPAGIYFLSTTDTAGSFIKLVKTGR